MTGQGNRISTIIREKVKVWESAYRVDLGGGNLSEDQGPCIKHKTVKTKTAQSGHEPSPFNQLITKLQEA